MFAASNLRKDKQATSSSAVKSPSASLWLPLVFYFFIILFVQVYNGYFIIILWFFSQKFSSIPFLHFEFSLSYLLGHASQDRMLMLAKYDLLDQLVRIELPTCEPYLACKLATKRFGKVSSALSPSEFIYSDICKQWQSQENSEGVSENNNT